MLARMLAALLAFTTMGCASYQHRIDDDIATWRDCVERALLGTPSPEMLSLALRNFRARCDEGQAASCTLLGIMYDRGLGTAEDDRKALAVLRVACAARDGAGCVFLVILGRELGDPVGTPLLAQPLLEQACAQGHPRGCAELGLLYAADLDMGDPTLAAAAFRRSCDGGLAEACYHLASLYETGRLPRDDMQAVVRFEQACARGYERACAKLDAYRGRVLWLPANVRAPWAMRASAPKPASSGVGGVVREE